MEVTGIKQQSKRTDRYSIFVDGAYAFSLSEGALLGSKLAKGQKLTPEQIKDFKQFSAEDKLQAQTLRYAAIRLRSRWEVEVYLQRKQASPTLIEMILNKLSILGLLDETKLAQAIIHDHQSIHPASRRKIISKLRQKHVADEVITAALREAAVDDLRMLKQIIARKQQQTKYQDKQKLMRYLAGQGFGYDDIKQALS